MPNFACSAVLVLHFIGLWNGLASAVQPPIPSTGSVCKKGELQIRWSNPTGFRGPSKPALSPDQQTLYFGSEDLHLYAINTANGKDKWDFYTPEGVVSAPAVSADGQAIFVGAGGRLYAVNSSGLEMWNYATDEIDATPALSESLGTVFVGSYDKNFYAFDAANGDLRWKKATLGPVLSSAAVSADQKTVFVGSNDKNLYAFNTADGSLRWQRLTGGGLMSSPVVSADQQTVFIGSRDKNLYAINAADGEIRWTFPTLDEVIEDIVVSSEFDQKVFVATRPEDETPSVLWAVNAADGAFLWKFETKKIISGSAVSPDQKTVFVGSGDGNLYALNTADGTRRWNFNYAIGGICSPTVSLDGQTVFFGSQGSPDFGGDMTAVCTTPDEQFVI